MVVKGDTSDIIEYDSGIMKLSDAALRVTQDTLHQYREIKGFKILRLD